jgi:hypothetical protein
VVAGDFEVPLSGFGTRFRPLRSLLKLSFGIHQSTPPARIPASASLSA